MYFDEKGAGNTEQCVVLALKTAAERNIRHIVVASGSGDTARLFIGAKGARVVCVTNAYGFKEPGKTKITDAARQELERAGIRVLAATHVLSGAERGISRKHGGVGPVELMADTLRMLGQGVKVCVEIAVMALDAGLIPPRRGDHGSGGQRPWGGHRCHHAPGACQQYSGYEDQRDSLQAREFLIHTARSGAKTPPGYSPGGVSSFTGRRPRPPSITMRGCDGLYPDAVVRRTCVCIRG